MRRELLAILLGMMALHGGEAASERVLFGPWRSFMNADARVEELGNAFVYYTHIHHRGRYIDEKIAACRQSNKPFVLAEIIPRSRLRLPRERMYEGYVAPERMTALLKEAGPLYLGRLVCGEYGGMLFWAETSLGEKQEYPRMPSARDLEEARSHYYAVLKEYADKERSLVPGPLIGLCSGSSFPPPGIFDRFALEMMPGDPERMAPAVRGVSRAYGTGDFYTLVAAGWYGGGRWDPLFLKRFRVALNYAYLAGFQGIFVESGFSGFKGYGNHLAIDDPMVVEFRRIMREFRGFCERDRRPAGGPEAPMAFLQGNLDGYPGLWTNCVWGQYGNPAFAAGEPEQGWRLMGEIFRKRPWHDNLLQGARDASGQPPCGMYDLVPASASLEALRRYQLLVVPGWNTMTDELYARLCEYVRGGGTLLMTLGQLRVNTRRDEPMRLYRDGDLRELFGVRVDGFADAPVTGIKFCRAESGAGRFRWPDWGDVCDPKFGGGAFQAGRLVENRATVLAKSSRHFVDNASTASARQPVLLEHALGKGHALLVNAACFPGNPAIFDFERTCLETLMRGMQPAELPVIASEKLRYAVYGKVVYVLNTDFDLDGTFILGDRKYQVAPMQLLRIER